MLTRLPLSPNVSRMARKRGRQPGLRPDGPKIRQIRISRGLSTTEVARRMGRDLSGILRVERVSSPVSEVYAAQLARALSLPGEPVTVADLLAKDDGSGALRQTG